MRKMIFAAFAAFAISFAASSCGNSEGDKAVEAFKEFAQKVKDAKANGEDMESLSKAFDELIDKYGTTSVTSSQEEEITKYTTEIMTNLLMP